MISDVQRSNFTYDLEVALNPIELVLNRIQALQRQAFVKTVAVQAEKAIKRLLNDFGSIYSLETGNSFQPLGQFI